MQVSGNDNIDIDAVCHIDKLYRVRQASSLLQTNDTTILTSTGLFISYVEILNLGSLIPMTIEIEII